MLRLVDLPDELLLQVIGRFQLWDLQNLSLTCARLRRVSYDLLEKHKTLKRRYHRLDDPQHTSLGGWLDLLLKVLKQEIPAEYVEQVDITQAFWYWHELPIYNLRDSSIPCSEADMTLVVDAIMSSQWIRKDDACGISAAARNRQEFISEVRQGDQDNLLAVLLPLLPNLKSLAIRPTNTAGPGMPLGSVLGIVKQVGLVWMANDRLDPVSRPLPKVPFQKLEHVEYINEAVLPGVST